MTEAKQLLAEAILSEAKDFFEKSKLDILVYGVSAWQIFITEEGVQIRNITEKVIDPNAE